MDLFLEKRLVGVREVFRYLGRGVFEDSIKAGKIAPRCTKKNEKIDRKFYAITDIRAIQDEMLAGKYPQPPTRQERPE